MNEEEIGRRSAIALENINKNLEALIAVINRGMNHKENEQEQPEEQKQ